MRRIAVGTVAFLALTGTFLVIPVYAAPAPAPHPVKPQVDQVALGSVTAPASGAVVTSDGQALPGAVTPAQATGAAPVPDPAADVPATGSSATTSSAPTSSQPSSAATSTSASSSSAAAASTSGGSAEDVATSGHELTGIPALTVSRRHTATFSSVGVTWKQDDVANVVVQLRVRHSNGHWGAWTTLQPDDVATSGDAVGDGKDVRGGTAPYWTGDSHGVQAIVQGDGGVVPKDVKVALINPGTSAADTLQGSNAIGKAHADDSMPAVYSRAQWGADESLRTWTPEYAPTIKAATLHHTADGNDYTADQVPAIMRSIYAYHAVTLGWGDIGYNVVVDKFGRIFEGRYGGLSSTVVGAHAGGFNYGTFGVSMLGNYDLVPVPQATLTAVAQIIAWKFGLYGVDPTATTTLVARNAAGTTSRYADGTAVTLPTIFGHRDVGNTVCPGQYGYADLPWLRATVASLMPEYDPKSVKKKNSSTGNRWDLSPVTEASVVSASGATTVFARGTDGIVYYRTGTGGDATTYTPWTTIPGMVSTEGPSAVSVDGNSVDVVVRGADLSAYRVTAPLDPVTGQPGTWSSWSSLGGALSSAPAIASVGPGQYSVVGRGLDGSVWQRVYNGTGWSAWSFVGGNAYAAPSIEADRVGSTWRYLVSVVGTDWRVWRVPTGAGSTPSVGIWFSTGYYSSHDTGSGNAPAPLWGPKVMSTGASDDSVVLVDPGSAWQAPLGGHLTSTASVARQPDGSVVVFARGGDNSLWMVRYSSGGAGTWVSLGGQLA